MEHIFKRFYRADSSRAREQGGLDWGFHAKAIVENHQGKLSVGK
jgi:signal transduction histidine kinase